MKQLSLRSLSELRRFLSNQAGATAIEYALIASLVSIAATAVLLSVGETLRDDLFQKVVDGFN